MKIVKIKIKGIIVNKKPLTAKIKIMKKKVIKNQKKIMTKMSIHLKRKKLLIIINYLAFVHIY